MTPLDQLIKAVGDAARDPAMKDAEETCLTLSTEDWKAIATSARVALAALRKVKRVGYVSHQQYSEEGEIAIAALKRIANQGRT